VKNQENYKENPWSYQMINNNKMRIVLLAIATLFCFCGGNKTRGPESQDNSINLVKGVWVSGSRPSPVSDSSVDIHGYAFASGTYFDFSISLSMPDSEVSLTSLTAGSWKIDGDTLWLMLQNPGTDVPDSLKTIKRGFGHAIRSDSLILNNAGRLVVFTRPTSKEGKRIDKMIQRTRMTE
jgi:hypothetical protein